MRFGAALCSGWLIVASAQTIAQEEESRTASWVIAPGGSVGPIRIGMSQDEVKSAVGEPKTAGVAWDYPSDAFTITFSAEGTVIAVFGGIGSPSPAPESLGGEYAYRFKARTQGGVGIGSTRDQVIADLGVPSSDRKDDFGAEYLRYREAGLNVSLWQGLVFNIMVCRPAP